MISCIRDSSQAHLRPRSGPWGWPAGWQCWRPGQAGRSRSPCQLALPACTATSSESAGQLQDKLGWPWAKAAGELGVGTLSVQCRDMEAAVQCSLQVKQGRAHLWEVKARRKGLSPKGSNTSCCCACCACWPCPEASCCPADGPGAAAPQALSGDQPCLAGSNRAAGAGPAGGFGGGDTTASCTHSRQQSAHNKMVIGLEHRPSAAQSCCCSPSDAAELQHGRSAAAGWPLYRYRCRWAYRSTWQATACRCTGVCCLTCCRRCNGGAAVLLGGWDAPASEVGRPGTECERARCGSCARAARLPYLPGVCVPAAQASSLSCCMEGGGKVK